MFFDVTPARVAKILGIVWSVTRWVRIYNINKKDFEKSVSLKKLCEMPGDAVLGTESLNDLEPKTCARAVQVVTTNANLYVETTFEFFEVKDLMPFLTNLVTSLAGICFLFVILLLLCMSLFNLRFDFSKNTQPRQTREIVHHIPRSNEFVPCARKDTPLVEVMENMPDGIPVSMRKRL